MVSIANAIPFNVIAENDQWSNIFDVLEHLKEKTISGMTFDEAFWRTLIASTDHPLGKHAASTEDLQSDFREWVISLLYSVHDGRIANFDEAIMALMISSASRLDDTKFDIMAFGKEGRGERPNPLAYVLESTQLMFDTMNKMEADSKPDSQEQSKNASKQLEDSIIRLWEANREGVFPSPGHIRETLGALNRPSRAQRDLRPHLQVQSRFGHEAGLEAHILPVQAQARAKSMPELRKACGLTSLLVIIEEREPWEQRL
jgi:hypothetical protein